MSKKISKKTLAKVKLLDKQIRKNINLIQKGNTLTEDQFCKAFDLPSPQKFNDYIQAMQFNMLKLAKYTKVNKLLAKRGLYIKSKNYYTEFTVHGIKSDVETKLTQQEYKRTVAKLDQETLRKGYRNYRGNYNRPLGPRETLDVVKRMEAKVKRQTI